MSEASEILRDNAEGARSTVRIRGAGTKSGWGSPTAAPGIEILTERLDRVIEHNAGDMTVVLQSGAPLRAVQQQLAESHQMIALDPPLGDHDGATIGGVVATGDSGPLRHRYGTARDLLLGIRIVLADGTAARSGGTVIKNVAGYDLAKLYAGSFGSLGLIVELVMRLHPRARENVTLTAQSDDPASLSAAAAFLAHAPLDLEALDISWSGGAGSLLARFGGAAPEAQAESARALLCRYALDSDIVEHDEAIWAGQRSHQRSQVGATVRVSALPADLERVLRAADETRAGLVGRAALGLSWVTLAARAADEIVNAIVDLRRALAPSACVVFDAPEEVRRAVDVWHVEGRGELELMRRVKARFDPAALLNPGAFVGGI